jgi:hypothetical protein
MNTEIMDVARRIQLLKLGLGMGLGGWLVALPIMAIAVEFKPPQRGIPGRREGAGTRGPACVQGTPNLTVLLPQTNIGFTTAAYPTFFWFVPETLAKSMKFDLFRGTEADPQQQLIYETTLDITASPGIVSLALPANANIAPLVVGQDYYWSVTLQCSAEDSFQNIQAEGWIQRVPLDPALARQLKTAKPSDRPQLYAQNGIWFDTLSSLATLQCTSTPTAALAQSWVSLLHSVDLDSIAAQSLYSACR